MLDPLTALGIAGPVLQVIRLCYAISSLNSSIRASGNLAQTHDLRAEVVDAHAVVCRISRLVDGSTTTDELTSEQEAVRALCLRCQNTGLTAAAQLKRVSESLSRQQSNLFTKKSTARRPDFNTQVDFAKVENYMHELRELTELAASKVVQSLVHSRPAHFKAISLKENALQSSLSTIVQLLEYGGANVKQNDFAHDGPAQQCMDVSTQSRLDLLHSMDTEPRSIPLQHTMLRRRIVLDLIHFRQMSDRIEEVNIAYENTLEWIFRDKDYNLAWSSFPDFLESSSDMSYWINGKAGSGKINPPALPS